MGGLRFALLKKAEGTAHGWRWMAVAAARVPGCHSVTGVEPHKIVGGIRQASGLKLLVAHMARPRGSLDDAGWDDPRSARAPKYQRRGERRRAAVCERGIHRTSQYLRRSRSFGRAQFWAPTSAHAVHGSVRDLFTEELPAEGGAIGACHGTRVCDGSVED